MVKGRDKTFRMGRSLLNKTVFHAKPDSISDHPVIFSGSNGAAQFRIGFDIKELGEGSILVHNTDVYVILICVV